MNQILDQLKPYLKRPYDYKGLICLADSTTFLDYIDLLNPLQHQVQTADFIIVNKTDLVDQDVIDAIHETIKFYNKDVEIYDTVDATVPVAMLERRAIREPRHRPVRRVLLQQERDPPGNLHPGI